MLRLDLNKKYFGFFLVFISRCVDNVADIYYNGGIQVNQSKGFTMHVEIFFETAELAANFNDFPVVALDGDRVVIHVDWHPSHWGELTSDLMERVGVVDWDTCDFF